MRYRSRGVFLFWGTAAALALLYTVRWLALATVLGVGIGVLLAPAVKYLKKRLHVPQGLSALFFVLLLSGSISGFAYVAYRLVAGEVGPLLNSLPHVLDMARLRILELARRYPWLGIRFERLDLGSYASNVASTLLQGLQLGVTAFAGLLFVAAIALYVAVDPRSYMEGFLSFFPAYRRLGIARVMKRAARSLRNWFVSQLIALSIVGLATGVCLAILGVHYATVFGLLTAIADLVPYLGPFAAFSSILIVTLGAQPEKVPWVAVLFILIQQFEGNVVIPLILKNRLQIPAVPLIVLVAFLASWFGFLGILVAAPLICVLRAVYLEVHVPRMNRLDEAIPKMRRSA